MERENSKGFTSKSAKWGTGRSHSAQPTRMSRTVGKGPGGTATDLRPDASHAKYGVDPDVGPKRMSRSVGNGKSGGGDARPKATRKGYAVDGVALKSNPGYGV